MTGCAVLTKSVLGFFPIVIGVVFMFWHGGFKKLFDPMYIAGVVVGLVVGCSWYVVNWQIFGDTFLLSHFKSSHMKIIQDSYLGGGGPFYLLGYFKDMLKNYWPWLPFAVAGVFLFARRWLSDSDRFLEYPVNDPETLFQRLNENPEGTWLSANSEFKILEKDFPGKLYLIYGNQRFAYFTSMKNRENVVYDFSDMKLPVVR